MVKLCEEILIGVGWKYGQCHHLLSYHTERDYNVIRNLEHLLFEVVKNYLCNRVC